MEAEESGESRSPGSSESGSDFQDNDDEPSESGEEGARVGSDEMSTKKMKTENSIPDEVYPSDDPIESSQRGIKRERDLDDQTENDEPNKKPKNFHVIPTQRTIFDCYDFNDLIRTNQSRMKEECRSKSDDPAGVGQSRIKSELDLASQTGNCGHLASPVIDLSSDESDEDGELPSESNTVTSANLKVVYGVEYRAPDESD